MHVLWLLVIFFFASPLRAVDEKNVIIFDLGGVLVDKGSLSAFWHIGPWNLFTHFSNPFALDHNVMSFLHTLKPRTKTTPPALYKGTLMPQLMCDYLSGTCDSNSICKLIQESIYDKQYKNQFFYKNELILKTAQFIFSPESLARVIYVDYHVLDLVKQCYNKKNSSGERINRIYILSNWDGESYPLLAESTFKELLQYVDGAVISYQCGTMKPDPAIIEHLLVSYDIDPQRQTVIFVDDQKENIESAQEFGINTIQFKGVRRLKKKLKKMYVL